MAPRRSPGPLLSFTDTELRSAESTIVFNPQPIETQPFKKPWYYYIPLFGEPYLSESTPRFNDSDFASRNHISHPCTSSVSPLCLGHFPSPDTTPACFIYHPSPGHLHTNFPGVFFPHCLLGSRPRSCKCSAVKNGRKR